MQKCYCAPAAALTKTAAPKESPASRQEEILVPIDFSESSVTALRHARALAQEGGTQVILLNVVEAPGSFLYFRCGAAAARLLQATR